MPSLGRPGENAAGSSKGYRNGTYPRDLVTFTGWLQDINVPRDREGQFHTSLFERYSRDEPHIADGLMQMFVAGVSTHKVGEVAQILMGVAATQPIANENALPLPTTIELRIAKAKYILYQAVCFVLVYTIIMALAGSQEPFSLRRFLLTFLPSLLIGGLLGLLNFYLMGRHMEQTLVVDDQGISILHSRGNIHIDWQAAQFFGVHRDRKSDTTGLYELSDETTTLIWRWFPPIITYPFSFLRLALPYDEYTHTMAALLSVVEGRTHLPLHDLHDYKARNT